jgi:hypothetical protein
MAAINKYRSDINQMNLLAASCEVSKRISHLILAPRGGEFNPERLKWERIMSIISQRLVFTAEDAG